MEETTVKCINHIFKPADNIDRSLLAENHGNCMVCTPDPENNPNCKGYSPIFIKVHITGKEIIKE